MNINHSLINHIPIQVQVASEKLRSAGRPVIIRSFWLNKGFHFPHEDC